MTPPRVLVVDDNRLNVELVAFVLEADGFAVESVMDAPSALASLAGALPDLILMDIQLPGMDGLALTRHIKADAATAHIPIVAFTAYAMTGDEAKARAAGCEGYVSKPIDVAGFARALRGFLPR